MPDTDGRSLSASAESDIDSEASLRSLSFELTGGSHGLFGPLSSNFLCDESEAIRANADWLRQQLNRPSETRGTGT